METVDRKPSQAAETLTKAFVTAFLLTGNAVEAESAVMNAIEGSSPDPCSDGLLYGAIRAAIRAPSQRSFRADENGLPRGLSGVLRLPSGPRYSFVLRVLAGLTRESCALLLDLSLQQLDEWTCAAVEELAQNKLPCGGQDCCVLSSFEPAPVALAL